jgi:hypothetical protein
LADIGGFNVAYPGIVVQADGLTFGVMAVMLWRTVQAHPDREVQGRDRSHRRHRAAPRELVEHVRQIHRLYEAARSASCSACSVVIAALNLVIDFDFIKQRADRAPTMEWYGAFALTVTVWLYLEILRLLGKLRK